MEEKNVLHFELPLSTCSFFLFSFFYVFFLMFYSFYFSLSFPISLLTYHLQHRYFEYVVPFFRLIKSLGSKH